MNSGYERRKYPEKSWSISKMKTLNSCEREYYYTYYGSHNGWIQIYGCVLEKLFINKLEE